MIFLFKGRLVIMIMFKHERISNSFSHRFFVGIGELRMVNVVVAMNGRHVPQFKNLLIETDTHAVE